PAGGPAVAGVVTGEIVFLAVLAVYLGWVLAATSRRPLASPAALATGTAAGAAAGVLMFLLPPRGGLLHLHASWQADLYRAGQMLAILLALAAGIAAGVLTARRTGRRDRAGGGGGGGGAAGGGGGARGRGGGGGGAPATGRSACPAGPGRRAVCRDDRGAGRLGAAYWLGRTAAAPGAAAALDVQHRRPAAAAGHHREHDRQPVPARAP